MLEITETEQSLLTRAVQKAKIDVYRDISKAYRDRRMTDDLGRAYDRKVNDLDALLIKINGIKINS